MSKETLLASFDNVVLETLGPDRTIPYWNTELTSRAVIERAIAEFNSEGVKDGELMPDFSEPEYGNSYFNYIHPERRCMRVSNLVLDGNDIKGTVEFYLTTTDEINLFCDLIDLVEESEENGEDQISFSARCKVLTVEGTEPNDDLSKPNSIEELTFLTFDILAVDSTEKPFPLTAQQLLDSRGTCADTSSVTLTDTQLNDMLSLQDKMNAHIKPNWKEEPFRYIDAVINEGAEARDHYGWKWWKQQTPDLPQVKMELVDIWHFYLSEIILMSPDSLDGARVRKYIAEIRGETDKFDPVIRNEDGFLSNINSVIASAALGYVNLWAFNNCMEAVDFTWEELYLWYIGKNVLNFFRQDNGYKEGTYIKEWDGKEDNEVLFEILETVQPDMEDVQTYIYTELSKEYQSMFV